MMNLPRHGRRAQSLIIFHLFSLSSAHTRSNHCRLPPCSAPIAHYLFRRQHSLYNIATIKCRAHRKKKQPKYPEEP